MAKSKVSSSRLIYLSGLVRGKIVRLPLLCVRKNCVRASMQKLSRTIRSRKTEVLGMVSHPGLYKSSTARYVTAWCHPYKNPNEYLPRKSPKLLLSESDFIDPDFITIYKKSIKWDYFYFTMGGKKAKRRKGMDIFLSILPALCKRQLRGFVINYNDKPFEMTKQERKIWKAAQPFIKYRRKKYTPEKVAKIMATSRFGLFPNTHDCSPLLLVESLLRNTPVFVHENILGGWKYVDERSGVLFTPENIEESLDKMLESHFDPRESFTSQHGFYKSAKRLARFGRQHLKSFKHCKLACFEGLSRVLKRYR